ncbi:MAG: PilN domain-containing protein, partial [Candidatus Wallbacteria bacterium]|nr:PilN domain-containing protein [Candidatus Wallbacteria bacterium]
AGFAEQLSAKLGVPAAPARCTGAPAVPRELAEDLGRFAGAYGVALAARDLVSPFKRTAGEVQVDFFKEGRSFWKYHHQKISAAVTTVLVLMLIFVMLQVWQIRRLDARATELAAKTQTEIDAINKASEARGRKKVAPDALEIALHEAHRRLGVLKKGPVSNIGILNEVSRNVPKGSSFTLRSFIVETGLVTIVADASSNDEADQITEAIKKSQFFSGVRKIESGPSPENSVRVQFRVQFKLVG